MAPRKRKAEQADAAAVPKRVTRSSTRRATDSVCEPPKLEKMNETKAKGAVKKEKKPKVEAEENTVFGDGKGEEAPEVIDGETKKTVIIEHCKQCNSFKTRAMQVKEGLEKGVPGITVLLNPDKPRRGCFEIREEGGETFISLLDMKRPFKPMKDLDMSRVIEDTIDKIK